MAFVKQVTTLAGKNLRILLFRHLFRVVLLAFITPIVLAAFFSFAKNLFVPPATFGISDPAPVKSLSQAFDSAKNSGRHKFALVNSGLRGGAIDRVLDRLAGEISDASSSMQVLRLASEGDLTLQCRSSLRGVSNCFGAVVMRSSPDEGHGGIWNYTIRTDGALDSSVAEIDTQSSSNGQQVYLLPVQHAVDTAIVRLNSSRAAAALDNVQEYPFTSYTQSERASDIRKAYQQVIISWMGVAFMGGLIWVTYDLTGFVASERESGMSQLIDAMMPVRKPWASQAARLVAHHLSFSLIYAPAWIVGSITIHSGVFHNTSIAMVLIFQILAGLAFSSMSLLFASFFKKAQLSGIAAILAIVLLGILAQAITRPNTAAVAILSVLFTPCTYVYFIHFMAWFEKNGDPANLVQDPPKSPWQIPGIVLWIFLIIHIFAYPLLGAYIENALYSNTTRGRKIVLDPAEREAMGDNAVQLRNFAKTYTPTVFSRLFLRGTAKKEPVRAVDDLTFNVGRGQIVALLGANGSGKSTTLDAIAGINKLTSGTITVDGSGGLGIAPQKNVIWDDLTVEEHIRIFNHLKAPNARATAHEIEELIKSVDLWKKRKAFAKTLSGGQKRKLQLGMMLTGGSAVCCVDEVSSGIDPLSRRKLWDILLAERGRRTLILTTHFLDEADLLADHIAILSKGTLRAEGSSVELKDRHGGGYRVQVPKDTGIKFTPDVSGVKKQDAFDMVVYTAPTSQLAASVIRELERNSITEYRFSGPTIEDVFLQLAEEIRDEEAFRTGEKSLSVPSNGTEKEENSQSGGLKLLDGRRVGYFKQTLILFQKRLTILKRNRLPYLIAFLLPILAAGLTTLTIKNQHAAGCNPAAQSSKSDTQNAFSQIASGHKVVFLVGPSSRVSVQSATRLLMPLMQGLGVGASVGESALANIKEANSFSEFQSYIKTHRRNVTTALWLGDDTQPPTIAWVANLFITSPITAQQYLDVLLTNTTIGTTWSEFAVPFSPSTGNALSLVVYMGIALSVYPAFFALYPSMERRRFIRGLEYSNGVRPFPLWVAYLLFDFSIALVSTAIATAVWAGVSGLWFHIGYIFLVFFLYALAATLMGYVVSLYTKSQLGTYAWAAGLQVFVLLVYIIAYVCVITYAPTTSVDSSLRILHFVISIFAPIASALRAMFVSLNLFSTACDGDQLTGNPGGILYYGGPTVYLIVQSIVLFGLLVWLDAGSAGSSLGSLFRRTRAEDGPGELTDEEVAKELARVTSNASNDNGLRVMHVTKTFGKNTAVDNVTFGIKRGEVFALLGPNGAGKSTTISLIRGDMKPSRNGGEIFVEDVSVISNLSQARAHLGVTAQVDGLDVMTTREHLEFYAKIRGISDVEHNVSAVLQAVGLSSYSNRMANALSGGNKRKLSLGVALMGNPSVVLLDEPSSGLDAASKRIMWKTLETIVPGRSILLTTHSMEEADALAGRVGILARRMLALGAPDELRHRFGDALHIHLVAMSAPRTSEEEMNRIIGWIQETLPAAEVDSKTYHGQIRFSVHASQVLDTTQGRREEDIVRSGVDISQSAIGHLVVLLEENRQRLGVGHYSVSPTTLDQVFLTIVGQHNIQEENEEEKKDSVWKKVLRFGSS